MSSIVHDVFCFCFVFVKDLTFIEKWSCLKIVLFHQYQTSFIFRFINISLIMKYFFLKSLQCRKGKRNTRIPYQSMNTFSVLNNHFKDMFCSFNCWIRSYLELYDRLIAEFHKRGHKRLYTNVSYFVDTHIKWKLF